MSEPMTVRQLLRELNRVDAAGGGDQPVRVAIEGGEEPGDTAIVAVFDDANGPRIILDY